MAGQTRLRHFYYICDYPIVLLLVCSSWHQSQSKVPRQERLAAKASGVVQEKPKNMIQDDFADVLAVACSFSGRLVLHFAVYIWQYNWLPGLFGTIWHQV